MRTRQQPQLKQLQAGFTLIELIIVIVIIGILAVVAIPKFTNLTNDAQKGVAAGVAGALVSANSINNAKANGGMAHTAVVTCTAAATLVDIPAGYEIVAGTVAPADLTTKGDCVARNIATTTNSAAATPIYGAP